MRVTTQITWRCDIRCAHCNQDHLKVDLDYKLFENFLSWVKDNIGLDEIGITGGEPFLKRELIESISAFANENNLPFSIITNGRWAKEFDDVYNVFSKLQEMGLGLVTVSTDKYHQKFVHFENILNILLVCQKLRLQTHVYSTLDHSDDANNELTFEFLAHIEHDFPSTEISSRYSIPVGYSLLNGISVNSGFEISELNLSCPQTDQLTVWPNGDVLPCCSAGTHSNLVLGNIKTHSPEDIHKKFKNDIILNLIRDYGIGALVSTLSEIQRKSISSKKYMSACHLCMEINSRLDYRASIRSAGGSNFDPLSIIFIV